MQYALVDSQNRILRYETFTDLPPKLSPSKGLRWLLVVDTKPVPGAGEALTGPEITVTDTQVEQIWTVVSVVLPVPESISDRQFFQALAMGDAPYISEAEALAAVKTGEIPAMLATLLAGMPEEDKFAAEMLLSGATSFRRDHPLTAAIGATQGKTPAEIDEFWRFAATL